MCLFTNIQFKLDFELVCARVGDYIIRNLATDMVIVKTKRISMIPSNEKSFMLWVIKESKLGVFFLFVLFCFLFFSFLFAFLFCFCFVLFCFCFVLFCFVLFCFVLFCVLFCFVLFCFVFCFFVLVLFFLFSFIFHRPYCTDTLNSNFAIFKTLNSLQLE